MRQENIRTLLNFFPVLGEDAEGRMIELDASQVLTFPQVFKAREVVRRGFLSNLLFANVAGIFRYSEHVKEILDKLPTAKQGKVTNGAAHRDPAAAARHRPRRERPGRRRDRHQPQGRRARQARLPHRGHPDPRARRPSGHGGDADREGGDRAEPRRSASELKEAYGLTATQVERDEKRTEQAVKAQVERAYTEHDIASKHLEDELKNAATEAEAAGRRGQARPSRTRPSRRTSSPSSRRRWTRSCPRWSPARRPRRSRSARTRRWTTPAPTCAASPARSRCSSWRTATVDIRLSNFDDYTPDDVFEEITGITEAEFRLLRDGQEVAEEDGTVTKIPGLFDEAVFDQAVQEFLDKKEALADYFDDAQTENIFAYIPQQKTSLVFTPQPVVKMMVDTLEAENPGIFTDPDKTFADLFSTAGLFLMELVRRLDTGLADVFPDQDERLRHILTSQVFEMSHNEILHRITIEAVSGGVPERKAWIEDSGHFKVGNLAHMTPRGAAEDGRRHADGKALTMSKKFDVVIGNPPYQEDQGEATQRHARLPPVHGCGLTRSPRSRAHHPGALPVQRGHTPKAWNEKMLADEHLKVAIFEPDSSTIFPGTAINGGIVVTYRDATRSSAPSGATPTCRTRRSRWSIRGVALELVPRLGDHRAPLLVERAGIRRPSGAA